MMRSGRMPIKTGSLSNRRLTRELYPVKKKQNILLLTTTVKHSVILAVLLLIATNVYGDENVGTITQPIRGGDVITGYTGVVDFFLRSQAGTGDPNGVCTGSMIAPNVLLTAAHCFESLGAGPVKSGNHNFTIRYYDPDKGIRIVFDGNARWAVLPSYEGGKDYGAGYANSDIGIIQIPGQFLQTDYHDYLRIFSDTGKSLKTNLRAYGAGRYTYSARTDNKLRTTWFEVEHVKYNHIVVDTRDKVGVCKGDSGGPIIYDVIFNGVHKVPTIAGVASNMETDDYEGDWCTNNDPPFDDAFYGRTNWQHMKWVARETGISCNLHSKASKDYRRCFDLPFIEDIAHEGVERDLSVAIVVSSII